MNSSRKLGILTGLFLGLTGLSSNALHAQVTTGGIGGIVLNEQSQPLEDAQIQVVDQNTGVASGARSNAAGRYIVPALEAGDTYTVTVRRIGFQPQTREGIRVTLSQTVRLDFALTTQATVLGTVATVAREQDAVINGTRTGVSTTVSDSALRRLPTLNRNFTDFVALTPQISSAGPGLSGGGVNNRFNNIQIDGAIASDVFGLGSTGQPGGQAGGKVISLEAVKQYQVLLTPFDVRQGNFAGALVNAVTKSGTNTTHGSAYYYTRNENLARSQTYISQYDQTQFGFSVGGPIIKDRIHYFVAPEFTRRTQPATGPYLGSSDQPVNSDTIARFQSLLRNYGLNPGVSGQVTNKNPLNNAFARIDIASLPGNSRAVISYNFSAPTQDIFSRSTNTFGLTSNSYQFKSVTNQPKLQLFSTFANGSSNEFSAAATIIRDKRTPESHAPQVTVTVPRAVGTGTASLVAGSERFSQGNTLDQDIYEVKDDYTFNSGAHRFTVGTQNQFYNIFNLFSRDSYGVYTFNNLTALASGTPSSYSIGLQSDPRYPVKVHMKASQLAFYAQDFWQPTSAFSLTYGLRLDVPILNTKPAHTALVATSAIARNTEEVPSAKIQYSPRVGFNWDVTGDQSNQLRGGVGMFVGRPAFVWLSNAYQNSGSGLGLLSCGSFGNVAGPARPFVADPNAQPNTCANGVGLSSFRDEIDLLSKDLRFPQTLRASLGYDHRLPWGLTSTLEGIYTKNVNDFFYVNRNLVGPQSTDAHGRVMYGTLSATTGASTPTRVSNSFNNVIEAINTSRNYSYNLTAQLQRRFADSFEATASYTYSRVRDAQSLTSSQAISNWRFGREWSGNLNSDAPTTSLFDQPHKVVLQGTYSFATKTDVSLYYIGQSGQPYDYVYGGSSGRGDMNADGSQGNDLFYVPTNSADSTQIVVSNPADLDKFINSVDCLRSHRGQILERNSCRTPWQNIANLTLRQSLPSYRGQTVSLELGVFNVLNLLNKNWGQFNYTPGGFSNVNIVTHTGMRNGVPVVAFNNTTQKYDNRNLSSNYQLQLSARYSF